VLSWEGLVVLSASGFVDHSGVRQTGEPMLVQALTEKSFSESSDVGTLVNGLHTAVSVLETVHADRVTM